MKLLDQVRDVAARRHLAQATIECYLMWIVHFLRFCKHGDRWREPRELGAPEVQAFLTYLARNRKLSASSQNQATCAIVFLYKQVLADQLPEYHLGRFGVNKGDANFCNG